MESEMTVNQGIEQLLATARTNMEIRKEWRSEYATQEQRWITDEELEILRLMVQGFSNLEISLMKNKTPQQLRKMIGEIMERFNFVTTAEMIFYFTQTKVLK